MNKKETSEGLVFLFFVGFGMGDNLAGYGVGRSVGYNPRLNINNFQILILRCFLYSYLIRLLIQNYKSKFNKNGRYHLGKSESSSDLSDLRLIRHLVFYDTETDMNELTHGSTDSLHLTLASSQ